MDSQKDNSSFSECRICRNLKDVETSFVKFGSENSVCLPEAARELVPAEDTHSPGKEYHHVKRCPFCGCLYRYDMTYDYYIDGSEDEETLTRLKPDEAHRFLDAKEKFKST